jgi:hypothetical protein
MHGAAAICQAYFHESDRERVRRRRKKRSTSWEYRSVTCCLRKDEDARGLKSPLKQRPFAIAVCIIGSNRDSRGPQGIASCFRHAGRFPEHRAYSKVWEKEKPKKNQEHL